MDMYSPYKQINTKTPTINTTNHRNWENIWGEQTEPSEMSMFALKNSIHKQKKKQKYIL